MLSVDMAWQPLQSSMIEAYEYEPGMRVLRLKFKRGDVVSYRDVPADVADGLAASPSAGRYFHQSIKDRFQPMW